MSEFNSQTQVYESDASGLKAYVTKVFVNMAVALGITAVVAFLCYYSLVTGGLVYQLAASEAGGYLGIGLIVAEFAVVIAFSAGITKFSTSTVKVLMFVYAAITGVTFAYLPLYYGVTTVFEAFLFAAVLFVCMAVIGNYTKVDLTKFSGLFRGALLAFVILTVISLFVPTLRDGLFMGYLGLVLFLGLTAWDMQKIKAYYYQIGDGTVKENFAVYSAFQMYLDFINVFLFILRILGGGRSRD